MRASLLTLFLFMALASAQRPPKSYQANPHLRGGNNTDDESNLRHGRTLLTFPVTLTLDADFANGSLVNVNYEDVSDQLQLDSKSNPCNFMWVACSGRGTVVKVNTITGDILGEYRSAPDGKIGDPSRNTVDQLCNVWLANRENIGPKGFGTIVHIGLKENNQCRHRNNNGTTDTSTGLGDIKSWLGPNVSSADDECILHYTEVNSKGTRHVSIDKDNNVWVGGSSLQNFDLVKGGNADDTGTIIKSYSSVDYGGHGGLIDKKGFLWSTGPLLRWDTTKPLNVTYADSNITGPSIGPLAAGKNWAGLKSYVSYGLCIDSKGNVWNTELGPRIFKYDPDGRYIGNFTHGFSLAQGCVVDRNDHVWVAHSKKGGSTVGHLDNAGTHLGNVTVGLGPTGVAVDAAGKVWFTNYFDSTLSRIDPALDGGVGKVDMAVNLTAGCSPYNYGDMTGSTNIAPPNTGSWTVIHDNGEASTDWGRIEWTEDVPGDSSLTVQVSSDGAVWVDVANDEELSVTGPKLHVRVLFQRATDVEGKSPVLYDLSLINNGPPDCSDPVPTPTTMPTPTTTPTPTTPAPTMPAPTTPKVDASCFAYPAFVELFGGEDEVIPGSMCCPTPHGERMSCCDETRVDPPTGDEPTVPVPSPTTMPTPTTMPAPTTPKVDASCSAYPACVELSGGADKVIPGSMCCPTPYGQKMSCCDA